MLRMTGTNFDSVTLHVRTTCQYGRMFRTQPSWQPWAKFLIVVVVIGGLILSVISGGSGYGLFVLARTICQMVLARRNNRQIQRLIRQKIITAVEKKSGKKCTHYFQQKLLNMPGYPHFRNTICDQFPRLKNPEVWNMIIRQVFLDLQFENLDTLPPVSIEIPIYRPESISEVEETLSTLHFQSYPAIREILLCFNDPTNPEMLGKLKNLVTQLTINDRRFDLISLKVASKRTAMQAGFLRHQLIFETAINNWQSDISPPIDTNHLVKKLSELPFTIRAQIDPNLNAVSVNIDADTQVDPDAIALGVLLLLLDPQTTAITSNVEIRNNRLNLLTLLTFARYKSANVMERAAQSSLRTVRCMSGPFMMFWTRNLISQSPHGQTIASEWVNERFLGVKVEPGDDRSWTVRHNEQGFGVRFHPDILVTSDCPVSWQRW